MKLKSKSEKINIDIQNQKWIWKKDYIFFKQKTKSERITPISETEIKKL